MSRDEFPSNVLRRSRAADAAELTRLSVAAFRGAATEEQWSRLYVRNPHLPPERVLVAERAAEPGHDRRLVGSAALLDLRLAVDGRMVPVDGVAAVAVHPAARRQGVADRLMREAVRDAHRRRVPYSLLYAFRGSFYRRFAYAPVEMAHALRVAPRDLPDSAERGHVRPYADGDREGIERCYRAWIGRRTGPLERSAQWWEWRVLRAGQDRVVYVAPRTGRVEGYALTTRIGEARLGDRRLRVLELVATSTRARRGLAGWLASLGDEFSTLDLQQPRDESWAPFLRDPNYRLAGDIPQQDAVGLVTWGAMARIADLERALATRRARGARGSLTVEVTDPVIPENQEPMTVSFGPTRLKVARGAHARLRVRAPIGVMTQVWLGAVSASQARALDLLEAGEEAVRLLDAACLGPAPFLGTLNEF
jgi:predicted acetyltransferase